MLVYSDIIVLHNSFINSGDLNKALSYCFKVVGYLFITFSDVPRHPLLGLQLYTLGDILMSQEGRTTEAHFVYSWSYNVMFLISLNFLDLLYLR